MATKNTDKIEHASLQNFKFEDGTTLATAKIAYKIVNPSGKKSALVSTCFGGEVNGTLNFSDGALKDHKVVVVALFGNGESSSPSNEPDFPKKLDYRDCIRAQHQLLTKHLNIDHLDVMIGFSMGGQAAYYWAALFPDFVSNAVSICSSARTSRHNFQFLEGPKYALLYSVDFENKDLRPKDASAKGVIAFKKAYSAWLTSAEWFETAQWKKLGLETQEDWDRVATSQTEKGWPPENLLAMLDMWQRGDVSVCNPESGGDLIKALGLIKARILVMPCRTDQYFHPEPSEFEVKHLKHGKLSVIESIWGHVAGGGGNPDDTKFMDAEISKFLAEA